MAKTTGTVKKQGSKVGKAAHSKKTAADSAQRRTDPAFMKNLEAAIAGEFAKAKAGPAVRPALAGPAGPAKMAGSAKTAAVKVKSPAGKASSAAPEKRAASTAKAVAAAKAKAPAKTQSQARAEAAERKALAAELSALVPELDAEGLAFLIEQARVHLYNMKVAELESAAAEAEWASTRSRKVSSAKPGAAGAAGAAGGGADEFTIQAASDGSTYDLVWQGKWKMFTSDEMLAMVRIASSKDPVAELGGRLYRWFLAERSDVLQDIPFSGLVDPKLRKIVMLLRQTFTVKK